jgi:hypothetical protein
MSVYSFETYETAVKKSNIIRESLKDLNDLKASNNSEVNSDSSQQFNTKPIEEPLTLKIRNTKVNTVSGDHSNAVSEKVVEENTQPSTSVEREYTPENVTSLKPNEVFVFGSNAEGVHGKGAALLAKNNFGAKQGQAEGLQGQAYGVITKKNWRVEKSSTLSEIGKGLQDMLLFAKANQNKKFLVTKLGSSLAGYSIEEIKGLFEKLKNIIPNNVILPKEYEVRDENISPSQEKSVSSNIINPEITENKPKGLPGIGRSPETC